VKKVKFVDLTLRDGQQSNAATRMTTEQILRVLKPIADSGFSGMEVWGGATLDSAMRYLREDPWERLGKIKKIVSNLLDIRTLIRGQNLFAYSPYPDDLVVSFVKETVRTGSNLIRTFDALNDWRNLQTSIMATKTYGGKIEGAMSYTTGPVFDEKYYLDLALTLQDEGCDQIAIKDMAGILEPKMAYKLIKLLKSKLHIPLTLHSHTTVGFATLNAIIAMHLGVDFIDTAFVPFAGGASHPSIEVLIVFADFMGIKHDIDKSRFPYINKELFKIFDEIGKYSPYYGKYYRNFDIEKIDMKKVEKIVRIVVDEDFDKFDEALNLTRKLLSELDFPPPDERQIKAQIPGGMLTNLYNQLKQIGKLDLLDKILEEVPRVRKDAGYPPLVTPTSQIIGSQAVFNVLSKERYKQVSKEFRMLIKGYFGRTPVPIKKEFLEKILGKDEEVLNCRAASYLKPALCNIKKVPLYVKTHRDLLLYLMLEETADEFLKFKYKIQN